MKPAVWRAALLAASLSLLLGYDIGIMSGAKRLIRTEMTLGDAQVQLLVGILNLVSAVGGLMAGPVVDSIGRIRTMYLACLISAAGAFGMAVAGGFRMLLLWRIVTGVGVGFAFTVSPLYMAETTPPAVRGQIVSLFDIMINVGIVLGFVLGWVLVDVGWRAMLGLGGGMAVGIVCAAALCRLPESPRWLLKCGEEDRAIAVLGSLVDEDEVAEAVAELKAVSHHEPPSKLCESVGGGLKLPSVRCALAVAFIQQWTGIEAAVYYTPEVLEASLGDVSEDTLLAATVGVGVVKVIFIIIASCLVDRIGRVQLLMASNSVMAVAHGLLALNFNIDTTWLALMAQCLFMAGFSIGAGPCSMMVAAEVLPLHLRGIGLGMATGVNRTVSGTVAATFLTLQQVLTPTGTFITFSVASILSVLYFCLFVPETKGRTLEEIENAFSKEDGGNGTHQGHVHMVLKETSSLDELSIAEVVTGPQDDAESTVLVSHKAQQDSQGK